MQNENNISYIADAVVHCYIGDKALCTKHSSTFMQKTHHCIRQIDKLIVAVAYYDDSVSPIKKSQ